MSFDNYSAAYRTKLGNLTAKSLLVLLVDEANAAEGLGFAGEERMAELTEIKKRTVIRMISVFEAIGLVTRTQASLKGRMRRAFQVNLAMLGTDLRDEFARAMSSQRKSGGKCPRDTAPSVPGTRKSVPRTPKSVPGTLPPHPLIGGPLLVPLLSPTPKSPQAGTVADETTAVERALDQVCSALAIANRRKRRLLRETLLLEMTKGEPPPTVALAMIAAWRRQAEMGHMLRRCGLQKFFGDGLWKDERRWYWDKEAIRERERAMH